MPSPSPWSIKGISPEARQLAKDAAQKRGMTLGAWMNEQIAQAHKELSDPAASDEAERADAAGPRGLTTETLVAPLSAEAGEGETGGEGDLGRALNDIAAILRDVETRAGADHAAVSRVDARIRSAESAAEALGEKVDALSTKANIRDVEIDLHLDSLKAQISDARGEADDARARVEDVSADMAAHRAEIDSVRAAVAEGVERDKTFDKALRGLAGAVEAGARRANATETAVKKMAETFQIVDASIEAARARADEALEETRRLAGRNFEPADDAVDQFMQDPRTPEMIRDVVRQALSEMVKKPRPEQPKPKPEAQAEPQAEPNADVAAEAKPAAAAAKSEPLALTDPLPLGPAEMVSPPAATVAAPAAPATRSADLTAAAMTAMAAAAPIASAPRAAEAQPSGPAADETAEPLRDDRNAALIEERAADRAFAAEQAVEAAWDAPVSDAPVSDAAAWDARDDESDADAWDAPAVGSDAAAGHAPDAFDDESELDLVHAPNWDDLGRAGASDAAGAEADEDVAPRAPSPEPSSRDTDIAQWEAAGWGGDDADRPVSEVGSPGLMTEAEMDARLGGFMNDVGPDPADETERVRAEEAFDSDDFFPGRAGAAADAAEAPIAAAPTDEQAPADAPTAAVNSFRAARSKSRAEPSRAPAPAPKPQPQPQIQPQPTAASAPRARRAEPTLIEEDDVDLSDEAEEAASARFGVILSLGLLAVTAGATIVYISWLGA